MLFREFAIQEVSSLQFPEWIRGVEKFPEKLYVLGNAEALFHPLVAVVGTRRPSAYGLKACTHFSSALVRAGFGIVSGLAVGVDAAAHRACLREGGVTVAVVAHGLDSLYPAQNRELALSILRNGGAIVSEFEEGVPAIQNHFPRRNRIISALAKVSLIVEASAKSGSLITARCACNQGRDVYVIPGPYDQAGYAGSHLLIQEGAFLASDPESFLASIVQEKIVALSGLYSTTRDDGRWKQWQKVFEALGGSACLLELVEISAKPLELVLSEMEEAQRQGVILERGVQSWDWVGGS